MGWECIWIKFPIQLCFNEVSILRIKYLLCQFSHEFFECTTKIIGNDLGKTLFSSQMFINQLNSLMYAFYTKSTISYTLLLMFLTWTSASAQVQCFSMGWRNDLNHCTGAFGSYYKALPHSKHNENYVPLTWLFISLGQSRLTGGKA